MTEYVELPSSIRSFLIAYKSKADAVTETAKNDIDWVKGHGLHY